MKKVWKTPIVKELNINATANGMLPSNEYDGLWVEIDGVWYRPGSSVASA